MDLSNLLHPVIEALAVATPPAEQRGQSRSGTHRARGTARDRRLIGVGDAAKPATVAAIARDAAAAMLIVAPRAARVQDLYEELGFWLGAEHQRRLRLYPQRDILPYERVADDPWDTRARLETIAALHDTAGVQTSPPIIVASAEAIAQRSLSREAARAAMSHIAIGDRIPPEELLRRLQGTGYEIVSLVEAPGQAARRGGILDVFPPKAESPARIEFFGPEVDSIRSFDVETQRSRERVQSVDVSVASDVSPEPALAASLLDSLDFRGCDEETELTLREELAAISNGATFPGQSFLPGILSPYSLVDHLPADAIVLLDETADISRALDEYVAETATMRIEREARGELPIGLPPAQANWADLQTRLQTLSVIELSRFAMEEGGAIRPPFAPASGYGGRVRILASDLGQALRHGEAVVVVSQQASRLLTLLEEEGLPARRLTDAVDTPEPGVIQVLRGSVPHGWSLRPPTDAGTSSERRPDAGQARRRAGRQNGATRGDGASADGRGSAGAAPAVVFLTDAEIFGFVKQRRPLRQPAADRSNLIADLSPGDYVVHLEHGIARFAGLVVREVEENAGRGRADPTLVRKEFLELSYAQGDRLFVPVEQSDRVARYVGPGDHRPELTRLGSGEWARTRERVKRAVADVAKELLDLYAARQVLQGHAYSGDTPWQQELEASFPYVETPDQVAAITAVKADMESPRPMDRLICGDVGFGKTEVAIRAAFKAVMDGFQVSILVPTTVLAQQHYNTFKERLASLPARVEMISRFLSDKEQRRVVAETADGAVDILIGTHRILQKDVNFKTLGLVIIDEEQRFGVAHKERLKQMRKEVDVLTLSATPIPRTLHMSLAGIRDLSNMMTAPEDRSPIRTYVMESDDHIIREAIARELERGGQVFFVHNRVYNIEMLAARIRKLVPEAEVGIGHGQMHEDQLERTMLRFARGEIDVLVCTTIIESGLDIPNANTIIINQADRLGLAQLYQLRGRVGRGAARAYAYLLYDRGRALSEVAQHRLQAVFEATELGAGMQIALRDLEIRGAGNLLGAEQSGHMAAVGFDLYIRLLGEAVERLKALQRGETPPPPVTSRPGVLLDLPLTAYLPDGYIPDLNMRLALYQRISQAQGDAEAAAIEQELIDRFGQLPPAARNLLWLVRLRLMATVAGVGAIQTEEGTMVIRLLPGLSLDRQGVARKLPPGSTALNHQVRLDRDAIGEGWREVLVRTLDAITPATAAASA